MTDVPANVQRTSHRRPKGATVTQLDDQSRAAVRDRRRASRIRTEAQDAVDVPISLVRGLLADATPATRSKAQVVLGPKTFAALAPELADAS